MSQVETFSRITHEHLEAFIEVAERRSVQAAARATGRARGTYLRLLDELRAALDAPVLVQRAAGQRRGVLTPAGETLAHRARIMLQHWEQWSIATRDALADTRHLLRVGTLAGSFDLIAEVLAELRREDPRLVMRVVEYPDASLLAALGRGEVDVGIGTVDPEGPPERLVFEPFGALPWAVIVPEDQAERFPLRLRMTDLDGVPLVVTRAGVIRERVERRFAQHEDGPLLFQPAFEVESTPRVVEMVARGFGPAIVTRFRLAFLPAGVTVRRLVDGPAPLTAGAFTRRGFALEGLAARLVDQARARFRVLAGATGRTRRE